jgi:hypothetical protein
MRPRIPRNIPICWRSHGIYDLKKLWAVSATAPIQQVPVADLGPQLDKKMWRVKKQAVAPRQILANPQLSLRDSKAIDDANLSYPILLWGKDHDVLDGLHRLARATKQGHTHIAARHLTQAMLEQARMHERPLPSASSKPLVSVASANTPLPDPVLECLPAVAIIADPDPPATAAAPTVWQLMDNYHGSVQDVWMVARANPIVHSVPIHDFDHIIGPWALWDDDDDDLVVSREGGPDRNIPWTEVFRADVTQPVLAAKRPDGKWDVLDGLPQLAKLLMDELVPTAQVYQVTSEAVRDYFVQLNRASAHAINQLIDLLHMLAGESRIAPPIDPDEASDLTVRALFARFPILGGLRPPLPPLLMAA